MLQQKDVNADAEKGVLLSNMLCIIPGCLLAAYRIPPNKDRSCRCKHGSHTSFFKDLHYVATKLA